MFFDISIKDVINGNYTEEIFKINSSEKYLTVLALSNVDELNVEVILTPGADKVMASVLSGDAEIGFSGPEATIYIKEGNEKDYVVNFAALTKRDGQFIVSRNNV